MRVFLSFLKPVVAAFTFTLATTALADESRVAELLQTLRNSTGQEAQKVAREIEIEWSKSGSASANLLLRRGEDALEEQNYPAAIEHFTALTDHAPDFAEGWHGRARVFYATESYGMALSDLKRTLALNPNHFGAIFGLGAIFEQIERPDQAYDAYQLLLGLFPAHKEANDAITRLEPQLNGTSL